MERLLTDRALARRLGHTAREQARRDFSWAQVAERVEQVYRDLIAEEREWRPLMAEQLADRTADEM
jgi:glycosyltransferase involved in cell wall biosynthesis